MTYIPCQYCGGGMPGLRCTCLDNTPINLAAHRAARSAYVTIAAIDRAVVLLLTEADTITRQSVERTGAIDPLAHEITALANAISRAVHQ